MMNKGYKQVSKTKRRLSSLSSSYLYIPLISFSDLLVGGFAGGLSFPVGLLCRFLTRVNGLACKNPMLVEANDFFFSGLHITGNTSNPVGSKVTPVSVAQLPGLNTLGISMTRIDYAPWGINPLYTHPRASEILIVLEGSLHVGFVTSNPNNRLITKVLQKGDVFVFPVGLVISNIMLGMDMQ
ncbi:hypothetical protein ACSBR2_012075 [Camellia fascicularis]